MEEQDDYVHFLPSKTNYRHIDTGNYYYYGDIDKCEELQRELNNEFEGVEDFCMRTLGILKNFDKLKLNTPIDEDKCEIVNYWVYHYLFNKIIIKNSRDPLELLNRISGIRKQILQSLEGVDKTEKCTIRLDLNHNNNFEKIKILFDYLTDYDTIKHKINNPDFECSALYKNYINNGVSAYESIKQDCESETDGKFYCNLLSDSNTNHNYKKLAYLKCRREKPAHVLASPPRASERQDLVPRPLGQGEDQLRLQPQSDQFSTPTIQRHAHSVAELPAKGEPSSSPLKDGYEHSTAVGESPPQPRGAFMTTVFPTVGSLFFFSMIYKFTPIGSKLHSLLRKSKIIRHSENKQDAYGLMQYPFELDNANYPLSAYGVGYQASRNS